jgi:hypothetical protein
MFVPVHLREYFLYWFERAPRAKRPAGSGAPRSGLRPPRTPQPAGRKIIFANSLCPRDVPDGMTSREIRRTTTAGAGRVLPSQSPVCRPLAGSRNE